MSSLSLDIEKREDIAPVEKYDVVVLGAGPYGLSVSCHLLAKGLKVATFGRPLHFWRANMPEGMLLRSYWWAANLSDPEKKYGFEQYFAETGTRPGEPLPIEVFIDYALWFQKHAVPDVDETYITHIERVDGQFRVTLEDGRSVLGKSVVLAPGLHYYYYIPDEYAHMPSSLISHSADHASFAHFASKEIAVVGKGQGALESAALLAEAGAKVHVLTRGQLSWLPAPENSRVPAYIKRIREPRAGMGNGWLNFLLEKYPYALQRLSQKVVDHVMDTRHGPIGSYWLKSRLFGKVTLHERTPISKVEEVKGRARLTFANGKTLDVDHIILGTGYRTDVKRLTMLDPALIKAIQVYQGAPVLNSQFETSVPGLYFVGYSSTRSFGPLYRFVIGVEAAARRVAGAIAHELVPVR